MSIDLPEFVQPTEAPWGVLSVRCAARKDRSFYGVSAATTYLPQRAMAWQKLVTGRFPG